MIIINKKCELIFSSYKYEWLYSIFRSKYFDYDNISIIELNRFLVLPLQILFEQYYRSAAKIYLSKGA